jgi:hypothetical protein
VIDNGRLIGKLGDLSAVRMQEVDTALQAILEL